MELKLGFLDEGKDSIDGSNRTFMELKFTKGREQKEEQECSNRTFMELKFLGCFMFYDSKKVLIVPLWN